MQLQLWELLEFSTTPHLSITPFTLQSKIKFSQAAITFSPPCIFLSQILHLLFFHSWVLAPSSLQQLSRLHWLLSDRQKVCLIGATVNAALCPGTLGIGTHKSEQRSHYHGYLVLPWYYLCAIPSKFLNLLHSLWLLTCHPGSSFPFALGPQVKRRSWAKVRRVPRKRRKEMLSFSFSAANEAEGQVDCNIFLGSPAFLQAVQPALCSSKSCCCLHWLCSSWLSSGLHRRQKSGWVSSE